jgi:hypothetical protein
MCTLYKELRENCDSKVFVKEEFKSRGQKLLQKYAYPHNIILIFYQVSSNSPKEFRRSCEDRVFFLEKVKSRGHNSLNKRPMGHIPHLSHLGQYKIFSLL